MISGGGISASDSDSHSDHSHGAAAACSSSDSDAEVLALDSVTVAVDGAALAVGLALVKHDRLCGAAGAPTAVAVTPAAAAPAPTVSGLVVVGDLETSATSGAALLTATAGAVGSTSGNVKSLSSVNAKDNNNRTSDNDNESYGVAVTAPACARLLDSLTQSLSRHLPLLAQSLPSWTAAPRGVALAVTLALPGDAHAVLARVPWRAFLLSVPHAQPALPQPALPRPALSLLPAVRPIPARFPPAAALLAQALNRCAEATALLLPAAAVGSAAAGVATVVAMRGGGRHAAVALLQGETRVVNEDWNHAWACMISAHNSTSFTSSAKAALSSAVPQRRADGTYAGPGSTPHTRTGRNKSSSACKAISYQHFRRLECLVLLGGAAVVATVSLYSSDADGASNSGREHDERGRAVVPVSAAVRRACTSSVLSAAAKAAVAADNAETGTSVGADVAAVVRVAVREWSDAPWSAVDAAAAAAVGGDVDTSADVLDTEDTVAEAESGSVSWGLALGPWVTALGARQFQTAVCDALVTALVPSLAPFTLENSMRAHLSKQMQ